MIIYMRGYETDTWRQAGGQGLIEGQGGLREEMDG